LLFRIFFEFGRAKRGSCAVQKPATGIFAVLSKLTIGKQNFSILQTTDTSFNAGTFATTSVIGTGIPASVYLSTFATSSFARESAIASGPSNDNHEVGVVDTANRLAYFALDTDPGRILRLNLDTLATSSITLSSADKENNFGSGVIDTINGFAYFGTNLGPAKIVKIQLSDFTFVSAIELPAGEEKLTAATIDEGAGFAYFGTDTGPAEIVKIDISGGTNFTRVGSITLTGGGGVNQVMSAFADIASSTIYFGSNQAPAKIAKIDVTGGAFTHTDTLTPGGTDENDFSSVVFDKANEFAYFGTNAGITGRVVKIDIGAFTRIGAIDTGSTDIKLTSAVVDTGNTFAYFGTDQQDPAKVLKINISPSNFVQDTTITLNASAQEANLRSAVIDAPTSGTSTGFAYFGNDAIIPGKVIQVKLFDRLFNSTGTFTSGVLNTGLSSDFTSIDYTVGTSTTDNIRFQLRSSTTESGVSSATLFGPTSSSDFYLATSSGAVINPVHDNDQYVQYRAYLDSTETGTSSFLADITINFFQNRSTFLTATSTSVDFGKQLVLEKGATFTGGDTSPTTSLPFAGSTFSFSGTDATAEEQGEFFTKAGSTLNVLDSLVLHKTSGDSSNPFINYWNGEVEAKRSSFENWHQIRFLSATNTLDDVVFTNMGTGFFPAANQASTTFTSIKSRFISSGGLYATSSANFTITGLEIGEVADENHIRLFNYDNATATLINSVFDTAKLQFNGSGSGAIERAFTLDLTVVDGQNVPIQGATVKLTDANSVIVINNETTDSNGKIGIKTIVTDVFNYANPNPGDLTNNTFTLDVTQAGKIDVKQTLDIQAAQVFSVVLTSDCASTGSDKPYPMQVSLLLCLLFKLKCSFVN